MQKRDVNGVIMLGHLSSFQIFAGFIFTTSPKKIYSAAATDSDQVNVLVIAILNIEGSDRNERYVLNRPESVLLRENG